MFSTMQQAQTGWTPLPTDPSNGVVSAWKKEGTPLICAEVTTDSNGEIIGIIKGTGDPRVSGEIRVKDFEDLNHAFRQMNMLLTALSAVQVPARARVSIPIGDHEVSAG